MTQADDDLRDRLRRALPVAMKARDRTAVTALRSALAAIDNAEAFNPDDALAEGTTPLNRLAGSLPTPTTLMWTLRSWAAAQPGLAGPPLERSRVLCVTEVSGASSPRKQVEGIVRAEIETLEVAADVLEAAGKQDHAEPLRAQMRVLLAHVNRT